MSKQSEAKERQGYDPKPKMRWCRNCENLLSKEYIHFLTLIPITLSKGFFVAWAILQSKAQAVCNEFKAKQ